MTLFNPEREAIARTVECPMPKCMADPGQPCVNTQSQAWIEARVPKLQAHSNRYRKAVKVAAGDPTEVK